MKKECPRCHSINTMEVTETCSVCCGQGSYEMAQDYAYGTNIETEICGCCGGIGKSMELHCHDCGWPKDRKA